MDNVSENSSLDRNVCESDHEYSEYDLAVVQALLDKDEFDLKRIFKWTPPPETISVSQPETILTSQQQNFLLTVKDTYQSDLAAVESALIDAGIYDLNRAICIKVLSTHKASPNGNSASNIMDESVYEPNQTICVMRPTILHDNN